MTAPSAAATPKPTRVQSLADWIERHPKTILFLLWAFLAMQISPHLALNPDGVAYMSIARSVVQHGKLARLGSIHLRYSPGYPISLVPVFYFGRNPFLDIQFFNLAFAAVFIVTTYLWLSRYDAKMALWSTALVMVNVAWWDFFRRASAEMVFMPILMAAAIALAIASQTSQPKIFRRAMIASVALIMLECFIRQIGVFLSLGFAAAMLAQAIRHRVTWKRAILSSAIVGFAAVAVCSILVAYDDLTAHADHGDYQSVTYTQLTQNSFRSPDAGIIEGLRRQTAEIGRLIIPAAWKIYAQPGQWLNIDTLVYLIASIPVAIGWFILSKRTLDPLALMFFFYFVFCVSFPFDSGTRYTIPMLPVIAASLWLIFARLPQPLGRDLFMIYIFVHFCVSVGFWLDNSASIRRYDRDAPALAQLAAVTPADSGLIAQRGLRLQHHMLLMYDIDRLIFDPDNSQPIPPQFQWLITPSSAPPQPGFQLVQTIQGFNLQHRISPQTMK
jgi:hypothetical protein